MTVLEELRRWQAIETEIKRLTGSAGWFLAQGARFPKHLDFVLVSEGCTFASLRRVADAIVEHFGRKNARIRIDYQNPIRGEIGITDVPPDLE